MTAPDPADVADDIAAVVEALDNSPLLRGLNLSGWTKTIASVIVEAIAPRIRQQAVPTAVAETLRYISQWDDDAREADDLRGVAADVDSLAKDPAGWICCPVCQEITCDQDCPLRTVRAALIGDSQ